VLLVVSLSYRPLLFASVDRPVRAARGLSIRAMSLLFMALLAITTVVAIQIVGVLLVFSLLVAPAAAAEVLTSRPQHAVALAMTIALVEQRGPDLFFGVWIRACR